MSKWSNLNEAQRFNTLKAMRNYGGSFVQSLAEAWSRADATNSARLGAAMAEYVENYGPGSEFYRLVSSNFIKVDDCPEEGVTYVFDKDGNLALEFSDDNPRQRRERAEAAAKEAAASMACEWGSNYNGGA